MEKQQDRVNVILGMMLEAGVIEDHNRELARDLLRVLYQNSYEDAQGAEIKEISIVMRHFQIHSTVEKTFTTKNVALNYASQMDKFENKNLPQHARGYHTVVTSNLEEAYSEDFLGCTIIL